MALGIAKGCSLREGAASAKVKILNDMTEKTPTWEELKAGYTLRPSEEYFKQFEFEEAEVVETKLNNNGD
jgi:hypothetical protein